MNITLVSMVYPHPKAGFWPGIERQVGDMAAALRDAGANVNVITSFRNGGAEREEHQGVRVFRVRDSAHTLGRLGYVMDLHVKSFGTQALKLREVLDQSDVIESFVPLPESTVLSRRDLSVFAFFAHRDRPSRLSEYLHLPEHYKMERSFFHRVKAVIVASSESRRVLATEYGVPETKIEIVPLGVAPRFLEQGMGNVERKDVGIVGSHPSGEPARLLYVGPLIRRKGLRTLVEALSILRRSDLGVRAVLAGSGPEKASLETLAASLGVGDLLEFPGFVAEADLLPLYRQADLFVFPSRKEGFGLVLVEAMASGLPVVASSAPPIPEVVGEAALLFKPEDPEDLARAVVRALKDPALRARLREAGKRRVCERYLWSRVAERTLEIYRSAKAA